MSNSTTTLLILTFAFLQQSAFCMDRIATIKTENAPKDTLIQPGKYFYQNRIPEQTTTQLTVTTVKKACQAFVPLTK